MSNKKKQIDPIPKEFDGYEEAAEFWDSHDSSDYPEAFETVQVKAELRKRHYEVDLDEDIVKILREKARKQGVSISLLVCNMLRQQMTSIP